VASRKKSPVDGGFLQLDNQAVELLQCGTKLNLYGVYILCKVHEAKRKNIQFFMSNETLAKILDTSLHTVKSQINILLELSLIAKMVTLNANGQKGKQRILYIPDNYKKTLDNLKANRTFIGRVPTDEKRPMNTLSLGQISTNENDPMNDISMGQFSTDEINSIKGQISTDENDPILREITVSNKDSNNINKLLEADNTSSPTSSNEDLRNDIGDANAIIPDTKNSVTFNSQNNSQNKNKESQDMARYANQEYEEMLHWFNNDLNLVAKYNYEIRYGNAAMNFAWGERERPDNQKDYYTPDDIIEYFKSENRLDYLIENNWEFAFLINMN
jgi:hypothetical protein